MMPPIRIDHRTMIVSVAIVVFCRSAWTTV